LLAFREQLLAVLPPVDKDTDHLLTALESAAVPWGIVSNGEAIQLNKIRNLGLSSRASCALVSEIVGIQKPDPMIFLPAAEQLHVTPREILFVGDHPVADIDGASAVGMQTAWVRRGRTWPRELSHRIPNYIIDSLADLMWIVESRS